MNDLTEQWKKGELPEGHYYIKTRSETNIDEYIQWYKDHGIPSEKSFAYFNVQQVLAPVPSYEEYLESESHCAVYSELNKWLKQENAQLKELLKELFETADLAYCEEDLLAKIDEAIKKTLDK